jgi:fumarate reductase flavoprotein subunit
MKPCLSSTPLPVDAPHVPAVIVGAGACGLTAALNLSRLGIECVVLERDATAQGSTALSSGFIPAPGTRTQQLKGITDSPDRFVQDIQKKAKGLVDPILADAYAHHIGPALDELQQHHGLVWEVLDEFLYPGHSVHRMHAVPERTGSGLMQRLMQAADQAQIDVLTHAHARVLHWDPHQGALGVGYLRPDGQIEHVACDALLLACNGFGGNPQRVQRHLPEMSQATYAGHVGNDGTALDWGDLIGAGQADLGAYQGHGSWATPQGGLVTWALMMEGGIQVNAKGQRFHNETQGYSEAAVAVLTQPDGLAWCVLDDPIMRLAQGFPDFVELMKVGAVRSFEQPHQLAQWIGCDAATLKQTLQSVQPGTDAATGRTFQRPLQTPLHALRVTGALFHTQGGLRIDGSARVLRQDGTPFPNLYAAGGAARGVSGTSVWGYLSGNGLLSAVAGGRIMALSAAQHIQQGRSK